MQWTLAVTKIQKCAISTGKRKMCKLELFRKRTFLKFRILKYILSKYPSSITIQYTLTVTNNRKLNKEKKCAN